MDTQTRLQALQDRIQALPPEVREYTKPQLECMIAAAHGHPPMVAFALNSCEQLVAILETFEAPPPDNTGHQPT